MIETDLDTALKSAIAALLFEVWDLKEVKNDYIIHVNLQDHEETEGETWIEGNEIFVTLNPKAEDPLLVLSHELVHVAQIIAGRERCEEEAYSLEEEVKHLLVGE